MGKPKLDPFWKELVRANTRVQRYLDDWVAQCESLRETLNDLPASQASHKLEAIDNMIRVLENTDAGALNFAEDYGWSLFDFEDPMECYAFAELQHDCVYDKCMPILRDMSSKAFAEWQETQKEVPNV